MLPERTKKIRLLSVQHLPEQVGPQWVPTWLSLPHELGKLRPSVGPKWTYKTAAASKHAAITYSPTAGTYGAQNPKVSAPNPKLLKQNI